MLRKSVSFAFVLLAAGSLNAATTTRYLVGSRRPLAATRVPLLQDGGEAQAREIRRFDNLNVFAADLTAAEARALQSAADVRFVEPVVERHLLDNELTSRAPVKPRAGSDTTHLTKQVIPWGIAQTKAPELWKFTEGDPSINVAIIDTGIDATHPELAPNYAGGYNTFDPSAQPVDDSSNGHGTHVAGTIAAADNGFGVIGMAPKVKLWSIKVLDMNGQGDTEHVDAAIDWVLSKKKEVGGNWIISLSLGSSVPTQAEKEAFLRAYDAGVLSIAGAGNTGLAALEYPAGYESVLAVGAIDEIEGKASFSSYGPNLAIVAPGVHVLSTAPMESIKVGDIQVDPNTLLSATPLKGSPKVDVTGSFVFCKYGRPEDFTSDVRGHIAVMQRGCPPDYPDECDLSFNQKVQNAMAAGAVAAIVFNGPDRSDDLDRWSLIRLDCENGDCHDWQPDVDYPWIVTLGLTYDDGQKLLASGAQSITVSNRLEDYTYHSGTSMATPHASGGAALLWSLVPTATARDIRNAMFGGAKDLGQPGYDVRFGHGELDVVGAAKILAPQLFGLPPAPGPTKRRS